jgi:hypothetical protein
VSSDIVSDLEELKGSRLVETALGGRDRAVEPPPSRTVLVVRGHAVRKGHDDDDHHDDDIYENK